MNTDHYQQLTENVVFAELPARTVIEVTGEDRAKFLHNLSTNDIKKLQPGCGCEAYFTTVQGKILLHASLFCHDDSIVIDASPGFADAILPQLDRYLITEDVTLTDLSNDCCQIWIAGPNSSQLLKDLGFTAPEAMLSHVSDGEIVAQRVPFASVDCFVLRMPVAVREDWKLKIESAGNSLGATSVDSDFVESVRIEAGYPMYGKDIADDNLPQEVGRDQQAISFTKGCYLGQETVARIDALGHVNRHLVRLEFQSSDAVAVEVGNDIATSNAEAESKVVGRVTSVTQTPQGHFGLGYVRRTVIEAKSSLTCGEVPVVFRDA